MKQFLGVGTYCRSGRVNALRTRWCATINKYLYCMLNQGAFMDDIERRIGDACASLAMEGLIVTEEEKELGRRCIRHEISYDDAVAMIVRKYSEQQND